MSTSRSTRTQSILFVSAIVLLGCGTAFLFFLLRALGQHSLYPNRDPRILESANLSN